MEPTILDLQVLTHTQSNIGLRLCVCARVHRGVGHTTQCGESRTILIFTVSSFLSDR